MSRLLGRREALRQAGAIALVAATASCGGVRRDDLPGITTGEGDPERASPGPAEGAAAAAPSRALQELLGYAALASSAHNSQPWRVRLETADRLTLLRDPARRLPAVDPTDRELVLSLGAFLETLAQAGEALGRPAEIAPVRGGGGDPDAVATIVVGSATPGAGAGATLEAIRRRRIVRSGYRDDLLRPEHLAALRAAAGPSAFFARGTPRDTLLREGTIEANRLQAARDEAQAELAEWIRWRNADARAKRDGLTPASMEIDGIAGWWVRTRYSAATVLTPGFRRRGVETATRQARAGAGWLVLTSEDDSRPALLDTGRRYQRVLLLLRDLGVAAHPMTQMLEEPPTRAGLERALGVDGTLQFLLRVGYVDRYPEPVSLRRPPTWFLA